MTEILLSCSRDGSFRRCRAQGHSGFALAGSDIVCAAETSLLRSCIDLLEKTKGVVFKTDNSVRGFLEFRIEKAAPSTLERLKCIGDLIRVSFRRLENEYPDNVHFEEITEDYPIFSEED